MIRPGRRAPLPSATGKLRIRGMMYLHGCLQGDNRAGLAVARLPALKTVLFGVLPILCAALWPSPAQGQAGAAESAVVLAYKRFGESRYAETNVTVEQLQAHIADLTSGRYAVRPLAEVVAALGEGRDLDNRTVAITIDEAYRSTYDVAWPRLKAAGLPLTLFVTTSPVDLNLPGYMSWDEIRELRDAGVTIGAHTHTHPHSLSLTPAQFREEMALSMARFQAELGERPTLFAYPYGEMSAQLAQILEEFGIVAAFGHHSGPTHALLDPYFMPRFPINERYGAADPFRLRLDTLSLPVVGLDPADPLVPDGGAATLAFTIHPAAGRLRDLNCFHSRLGPVELAAAGERRFELRLDGDNARGAWRINCTMPTGGKRYRWLGLQYFNAD